MTHDNMSSSQTNSPSENKDLGESRSRSTLNRAIKSKGIADPRTQEADSFGHVHRHLLEDVLPQKNSEIYVQTNVVTEFTLSLLLVNQSHLSCKSAHDGRLLSADSKEPRPHDDATRKNSEGLSVT